MECYLRTQRSTELEHNAPRATIHNFGDALRRAGVPARVCPAGRRRRRCSDAREDHTLGASTVSLALNGPVDRGSPDAEQLRHLDGAVVAAADERHEGGFLAAAELGLLPRRCPLAFATFMPSRVRSRIRSASNSATMASTLNNSRPTASVGSYTDPPRLRRTDRAVSSSAIARASGSDRARRSSLVTTRVSPARQAANASRRPGRSRLVSVRPWST
jgi:hypothetical protein